MALTDEFNLHFNRYKVRFPNATPEQFVESLRGRNNDLYKKFTRVLDYASKGAGEIAKQAPRALGRLIAPFAIAEGVFHAQPTATDEQEKQMYEEAVQNGFVPNMGNNLSKTPSAQPNVATGLFSPLGPIGTVVGITQNLMQRGKSNEFNDRLGRYSNPDTVNYDQLNISPEKKQKFEQMMQEKAAGGTGEIARQKDRANITEPTNQEVPEEKVTPSTANGGLPPTNGLIVDNTGNNGDNSQNLNLVPITNINGVDSMDNTNNNNIQPQAQAPTPVQNNGVMGAAANIGDIEMINQLMNPAGQITPEQMKNYIDQAYNAQVQAANRNPLYGGEYVQPGGYQIDEKTLSLLQNIDRATAGAGGSNINNAREYIDSQRQMYNAQMANRAGVPYEDYVAGMAKRNADEIAIRQKQAEAQLTAYAQQSTDMNTRLQVAQKIMHDRQEAQNKIDEIYANMQKDLAVENLKGKWDYAKQGLSNVGTMQNTALQGANAMNLEQYKQTNPQAVFRNLAYFLYNAGIPLMGDKKAMARLIASQPQGTQIQMFGRVVSPDEAEILLNSMQTQEQNNPGWFQRFLNPGNYNINFGQ